MGKVTSISLTHFGSICYGAFILAVVSLIRIIVDYLKEKQR